MLVGVGGTDGGDDAFADACDDGFLGRASDEAVEAARLYAVQGGTVLLAPGPAANSKKFNETFKALLPAPLGPTSPIISPGRTVRLISLRTGRVP